MSAPLTVADVLERAADLIEPEGAWTQGANARSRDRRYLSVHDRHAACWCMAGAIMRASGGAYPKEPVEAILPSTVDGRDRLVAFNDAEGRTQAEVVAKLREAAALARSDTPAMQVSK